MAGMDWGDIIPNPSRYYDIDGEPISLNQWSHLFEKIKYRRVAWTKVHDRWVVSTVWLGLDHSFGESRLPLIFETMVFDERSESPFHDMEMERYTTKQQAIDGHARMVAQVEDWDQ